MKKLLVTSLLLLAVQPTVANEFEAQIATCAKISDSLQRLVCYDKVAKRIADKPQDVAIKPVTKPSAKTSEVKQTKADDSSISATELFGNEGKVIKKSVDEVIFTIKTAKQNLRKKWQFVFENGQKWEQRDSDKFAKYQAGEKVIIKRGLMNAFYLKKLDANRTIRVKRVK